MAETSTELVQPTTTEVRHSYKKESQIVPGIDNHHLMIGGILLAIVLGGFAVSQTPTVKNMFGNFFNKNGDNQKNRESRVQYNQPQQPQNIPAGFQIQNGQVVPTPQRKSREDIFEEARQAQASGGNASDDYGANTISPAAIGEMARARNYPHVHQHTRGPQGNQIRPQSRPGPQYESPFGAHISGPS